MSSGLALLGLSMGKAKKGVDFDLKLATTLALLAKEAYKSPPNLDPSKYGFTLQKFIQNSETDTQAYIATGEAGEVVVSFRGTSGIKDAFSDLLVVKCRLPRKKFIFIGPRVHFGFSNAYESVRKQVIESVKSLANPNSKLYVTGHSLGGALATLGALDLSQTLKREVSMYNIGSPRVGNHSFEKLYRKRVPNSWRVVNDEDIITTIPKLNYHHIGRLAHINGAGNLELEPSFMERVIDRLDDLLEMINLEALQDHCSRFYTEALTRSMAGLGWSLDLVKGAQEELMGGTTEPLSEAPVPPVVQSADPAVSGNMGNGALGVAEPSLAPPPVESVPTVEPSLAPPPAPVTPPATSVSAKEVVNEWVDENTHLNWRQFNDGSYQWWNAETNQWQDYIA